MIGVKALKTSSKIKKIGEANITKIDLHNYRIQS